MTDARPTDSTISLETADALAESGDWPAAIEAWHVAATGNPTLRPAVERRLEWFLGETGDSDGNWRRVLSPMLVFLAMTLLGMSFLLFAGEPGSTGANIWAIAIWVATAVACVAALVAARRTGEASLGDRIASARRTAARLDHERATGERA